MIEKYFYTKEFKELVEELDKKGALNYSAVYNVDSVLRKDFQKSILIFFAVTFLMLLFEGILVALVALILSVFLVILDQIYRARLVCNRYSLLVTNGRLCDGQIKKCRKVLSLTGPSFWRIDYAFQDDDGEYNKGRLLFLPLKFNDTEYEAGDTIGVYYDSKAPQKNIIALSTLVDLFDLNKEIDK